MHSINRSRYFKVYRKKDRNKKRVVIGPIFARPGVIQIIKEEWYTEYLQSAVDYLNKKVFDLSYFKVCLVMDHDCHTANNSTKIDKRHLRKIADPIEISFVNMMQRAVNYGNREVYRSFKLRLEIEYLLATSGYSSSYSNTKEVVA